MPKVMTVLPIFLVVASCVACELLLCALVCSLDCFGAVNNLARCVSAVGEVVLERNAVCTLCGFFCGLAELF